MRAQLHRNITVTDIKTASVVARKKRYSNRDRASVTHSFTPKALHSKDKQACMRYEVISN
jgi:hypothetical protein